MGFSYFFTPFLNILSTLNLHIKKNFAHFFRRAVHLTVALFLFLNQVVIPLPIIGDSPLKAGQSPMSIQIQEPVALAAACGNGSVESPETCDDGNTRDSDGCSATCTTEKYFICTGQPSACSWVPPIGIPKPTFGIEESHWMYAGQPGYLDAGNGPYTHYVDNASPASTDTSNPNGDDSVSASSPASRSTTPGNDSGNGGLGHQDPRTEN